MFEFEYILDSSVVLAGEKVLKKYLVILNIVFPLIVSLEYFIKFFKTKNYFQLLFAFISIFLFYLIIFFMNLVTKKILKSKNEKFLNQKVNISFSDSKIIIKTKKEEHFESSQIYEWNMIQKFEQVNSHYFLYLSKFKSYVIPKGSCINGNELNFVSFIENRLKENI